MDIPHKKHDGYITIEVRVQPRSSRAAIDPVASDALLLKVKLTAPPAGGEANKQLIALLSKELRVPKTSIRIIKGKASRNKVVRVDMPQLA